MSRRSTSTRICRITKLTGARTSVQVLARQPIDLERPHPFTEAGAREFNCLLWMPPNEQRAGDIVLVDSTNFTTLFGGTKSSRDFLEAISRR